MSARAWEAGVWDQLTNDEDGIGLVVWSRHSTEDLARRAARRYARRASARTGGPLSWSGGVRSLDGSVRWYGPSGELVYAEGGESWEHWTPDDNRERS